MTLINDFGSDSSYKYNLQLLLVNIINNIKFDKNVLEFTDCFSPNEEGIIIRELFNILLLFCERMRC